MGDVVTDRDSLLCVACNVSHVTASDTHSSTAVTTILTHFTVVLSSPLSLASVLCREIKPILMNQERIQIVFDADMIVVECEGMKILTSIRDITFQF